MVDYGPALEQPWCVREDLVTSGTLSTYRVWTSKGAYGYSPGSIWDIKPASNLAKDHEGWFPLLTGGFRFNAHEDTQPGLRTALVLRVPLEKNIVDFPNEAPEYNKGNPPTEGQLVGEYHHGEVSSTFVPILDTTLTPISSGRASIHRILLLLRQTVP